MKKTFVLGCVADDFTGAADAASFVSAHAGSFQIKIHQDAFLAAAE